MITIDLQITVLLLMSGIRKLYHVKLLKSEVACNVTKVVTFTCSSLSFKHYLYSLSAMIKQFLTDVVWSDVDYLIIDTPPGMRNIFLLL